jgi:putative transposase
MARVVCPGFPHHITQRGVRRFATFLDEADHARYLELLGNYSLQFRLRLLAYCVMTNHIHVVATPERPDSISNVFRDCHGTYAGEFNKKYGKSGHVWQARPYSRVLDESHTWAAIRYVERNPIRAGMVARAEDYRWSSARAHCGLTTDSLLTPLPAEAPQMEDWSDWLADSGDVTSEQRLRSRTYTGRPCGTDDFVTRVERATGRALAPRKPGPKPRQPASIAEPSLWTIDEIRR